MIDNTFIQSPEYQDYLDNKELISKESVVFVEDKEKLITQGKEYLFVPSGGESGLVLQHTENGLEWKDNEAKGGNSDWNAKEGEDGFIKNKPFGECLTYIIPKDLYTRANYQLGVEGYVPEASIFGLDCNYEKYKDKILDKSVFEIDEDIYIVDNNYYEDNSYPSYPEIFILFPKPSEKITGDNINTLMVSSKYVILLDIHSNMLAIMVMGKNIETINFGLSCNDIKKIDSKYLPETLLTKTEASEIYQEKFSNGEVGQVLTQGESGIEWKDIPDTYDDTELRTKIESIEISKADKSNTYTKEEVNNTFATKEYSDAGDQAILDKLGIKNLNTVANESQESSFFLVDISKLGPFKIGDNITIYADKLGNGSDTIITIGSEGETSIELIESTIITELNHSSGYRVDNVKDYINNHFQHIFTVDKNSDTAIVSFKDDHGDTGLFEHIVITKGSTPVTWEEAQSSGIPFLTKTEASETYQEKGNYLTEEKGNELYELKKPDNLVELIVDDKKQSIDDFYVYDEDNQFVKLKETIKKGEKISIYIEKIEVDKGGSGFLALADEWYDWNSQYDFFKSVDNYTLTAEADKDISYLRFNSIDKDIRIFHLVVVKGSTPYTWDEIYGGQSNGLTKEEADELYQPKGDYPTKEEVAEKLDEELYTTLYTNGHDYVDMGEAGIWATCNVGASKPEENGLYFAWGETEGYPNATGDKKFTWDDYKYGTSSNLTKYNSSDGLTTLELEDDAAHVIMGGDWRMPTKDEFKKLNDLCNSEWTDNYNNTGIKGRIFKLKTDESKQLFFPAAGNCSNGSVYYVGSYGYVWSSSLHSSISNGCNLSFYSSNVNVEFNNSRYTGCSVRGILNRSPKSPKYLTKTEAKEIYQEKLPEGNVGQVLTKTEEGAEWKNIVEPLIINIEDDFMDGDSGTFDTETLTKIREAIHLGIPIMFGHIDSSDSLYHYDNIYNVVNARYVLNSIELELMYASSRVSFYALVLHIRNDGTYEVTYAKVDTNSLPIGATSTIIPLIFNSTESIPLTLDSSVSEDDIKKYKEVLKSSPESILFKITADSITNTYKPNTFSVAGNLYSFSISNLGVSFSIGILATDKVFNTSFSTSYDLSVSIEKNPKDFTSSSAFYIKFVTQDEYDSDNKKSDNILYFITE